MPRSEPGGGQSGALKAFPADWTVIPTELLGIAVEHGLLGLTAEQNFLSWRVSCLESEQQSVDWLEDWRQHCRSVAR